MMRQRPPRPRRDDGDESDVGCDDDDYRNRLFYTIVRAEWFSFDGSFVPKQRKP